jgi:hypothetical protein
MPRRRRGASAVAIDAEAERGLAMRILLHSPKDMVAGALAFAAITAIIANALFLQAGRHPSPMFGTVVAVPAAGLTSPLPRPRPAEAALFEPKSADPRPADPRPAESRPVESRPVESRSGEPKHSDPMANLVRATTAAPAASPSVLRPPAPIPAASRNDGGPVSASRRVASVQRALTEYGYGQLKPTGTVGSDTQAAIQRFERERKIPVTGQMSDRLVKELAAVTGKQID